MNDITEVQKAYLAGLIDGEGCIHISRRIRNDRKSVDYNPCVVIAQSDREFLSHWQQIAGVGKLYKIGDATGFIARRMRWQWRVTGREAYMLAEVLLPYLVLKLRQCSLLVEWAGIMSGGLAPDDVATQRERIRLSITEMNQGAAI